MAFALRSSVMPSRTALASRSARSKRCVVQVARSSRPSLDAAVEDALKVAEEDCNKKGVHSKECEIAWDIAEELLAAKSHQKVKDQALMDPLELFCLENEDADECRIHEL